jgi:hypothetical protein
MPSTEPMQCVECDPSMSYTAVERKLTFEDQAVNSETTSIRRKASTINRLARQSPLTLTKGIPLNFNEWCLRLSPQVDLFTCRGSGFTLEQRQDFTLITRYLSKAGSSSSFVETPEWLHAKRCVINVHNEHQNCFVWSVLASLLYDKCNVNPGRMEQYRRHLYLSFGWSRVFYVFEYDTKV